MYRIYLLLFFVLTLQLTNGQVSQKDNTVFWKIERKGIAPSYLYGTVHMICSDEAGFSEELTKVLPSVNTLYLEVDLSASSLIQMGKEMLSDRKLDNYLEQPQVDSLKKFIAGTRTPLPWFMVNMMKPLMLQSALLQGMLECEAVSVDMLLSDYFKKNKKEVRGLETAEFQVALLDRVKYEDQVEALLSMMRDPATSKKEYDRLLQAYKQGDLHQLMVMMEEEDSYTSVKEDFLDNRNKNWVKQITANAGSQTYLYAFGAGHLGGKAGVIQLLRDEGFKVTPIVQK